MVISSGKLLLTEADEERAFAHPIDHFFRLLAIDVGKLTVAIVLSGTGSDGSRGIHDVYDQGGLVVVQDERSAKFDGMPMNAQATGIVDLVLHPTEIAEALVRHVREGLRREELVTGDKRLANVSGTQRIFRLLNQQHGLDFSHYKSNIVGRRIQRRIELRHIDSLNDYVKELETDPAELNQLYKDLFIGVTKFFRGPDAFAALEKKIIPKLFADAVGHRPIRVRVAGCASGEEAYSIVILLDEKRRRRQSQNDIKIFATDAHHVSLNAAAEGVYDDEALSAMSQE